MTSDSQNPQGAPKFGWNVPANFDRLERLLIAATDDRAKLDARIATLENNQSVLLDQQQSLVAAQGEVITRLGEQQSRSVTLADNLRRSVDALTTSLQEADHKINNQLDAIRAQQESDQSDDLQTRKEVLQAQEDIGKINEQVRDDLFGRIASLEGNLNTIFHNGVEKVLSSIQSNADTLLMSVHGAVDSLNSLLEEIRAQQSISQKSESQAQTANLSAITDLGRTFHHVGTELDAKISNIENNAVVAREQAEKEARVLMDSLRSELTTLVESMGRLEAFSAELIPMNSQYFHTLSDARTDISRVDEVVSELYTLVLSNFNAATAPKSIQAAKVRKKRTTAKPRKVKGT
jgi:hypothetical protein